jgi:trimeric autotransporter adhesin
MQQIKQATVKAAVMAQCEPSSPGAAAASIGCASAEVEALRNELAARDAAIAESAICTDTMMMRLHEAHAECAAAAAALARIQYSAASRSPTEIAAKHPTPSHEARIVGEAALGDATAALHTAQAETAERDAALVRARAEVTEQRSAARDEIETLRKQLADCRQALARVGQPPVECRPLSAAATLDDAEPASEAAVAGGSAPAVDPEKGT